MATYEHLFDYNPSCCYIKDSNDTYILIIESTRKDKKDILEKTFKSNFPNQNPDIYIHCFNWHKKNRLEYNYSKSYYLKTDKKNYFSAKEHYNFIGLLSLTNDKETMFQQGKKYLLDLQRPRPDFKEGCYEFESFWKYRKNEWVDTTTNFKIGLKQYGLNLLDLLFVPEDTIAQAEASNYRTEFMIRIARNLIKEKIIPKIINKKIIPRMINYFKFRA